MSNVDARPSLIYKPRTMSAFLHPMTIVASRGLAVGPEGMRVR